MATVTDERWQPSRPVRRRQTGADLQRAGGR